MEIGAKPQMRFETYRWAIRMVFDTKYSFIANKILKKDPIEQDLMCDCK